MWTKALLACVAILAEMHAALASESLYDKGSPILQIQSKKQLNQLINTSNHTSIVEFYAPWCGHCKNLKGDYEKAARSLAGMVNVAAVNCEDARDLCSSMGVQGFPTLKIVRPAKAAGRKPAIDDYQGQRTAASIVDSLAAQMNNHVVKVTDASLDAFLAAAGPKALLFTEKGTTAPTTKALATDFLGVLAVGQVRNKEKAVVERFGVTAFPALILLPEGDQAPVAYGGKMKLKDMVAFLTQAAEPNKPVDINASAPPKKAKEKKAKKNKGKNTGKETKEETEKESKTEKSEKNKTGTAGTETTSTPTEQETAPVIIEGAVPIPTIHTPEKLQSSCLTQKAPTCVLVLVGDAAAEKKPETQEVLDNLAELAYKYAHSKRAVFPFYAVPETNAASATLRKALGLASSPDQVQLVAVNARRRWWRHYQSGDDLSFNTMASWIDTIRMSEGPKEPMPEDLVAAVETKMNEDAKEELKEKVREKVKDETTTDEVKHEEL